MDCPIMANLRAFWGLFAFREILADLAQSNFLQVQSATPANRAARGEPLTALKCNFEMGRISHS
jgi:hypothetical protein